MGASSSMQNFSSTSSEIFFDSVVKVNQKCKSSSLASNVIKPSVDNRAVLKTCLKKSSPKQCAALMGSVNVSNVKQTADLEISTNCRLEGRQISDLQALFTNTLMQRANEDKGLVDVLKAFTSSRSLNANSVRNTVNQTFTASMVNTIISRATAKNVIAGKARGGNLNYTSIDQSTRLRSFTTSLMQNEAIQRSVAIAETKTDQTSEISSAASSAMSGSVTIILGIVGIYLLFLFMKSKGKGANNKSK